MLRFVASLLFEPAADRPTSHPSFTTTSSTAAASEEPSMTPAAAMDTRGQEMDEAAADGGAMRVFVVDDANGDATLDGFLGACTIMFHGLP